MQTIDRYFTKVALPGGEPVYAFIPVWEEPFVTPMFGFDIAKKVLQSAQVNGGIKAWKYDDDADQFIITYADGEKETVSGEDVDDEYWFYKVGAEWPWKDVKK